MRGGGRGEADEDARERAQMETRKRMTESSFSVVRRKKNSSLCRHIAGARRGTIAIMRKLRMVEERARARASRSPFFSLFLPSLVAHFHSASILAAGKWARARSLVFVLKPTWANRASHWKRQETNSVFFFSTTNAKVRDVEDVRG